jgi:hypothetical protein
MKITIDTKEDTHDDIKKVLHVLTNIIERKDDSVLTETNEEKPAGFMNMFGDQPKEEKTDTAPDFNSFLNLVDKKDEEKEEPKLQFF